MSAPYNFTNLTNSNDFSGFFTFANESTNYIFGWFILLVVFLVMYIAMKDYPASRSVTAASFVCTLFAFLLQTFQAVPDLAVTTFVLLTCAGLAWIVMSD